MFYFSLFIDRTATADKSDFVGVGNFSHEVVVVWSGKSYY